MPNSFDQFISGNTAVKEAPTQQVVQKPVSGNSFNQFIQSEQPQQSSVTPLGPPAPAATPMMSKAGEANLPYVDAAKEFGTAVVEGIGNVISGAAKSGVAKTITNPVVNPANIIYNPLREKTAEVTSTPEAMWSDYQELAGAAAANLAAGVGVQNAVTAPLRAAAVESGLGNVVGGRALPYLSSAAENAIGFGATSDVVDDPMSLPENLALGAISGPLGTVGRAGFGKLGTVAGLGAEAAVLGGGPGLIEGRAPTLMEAIMALLPSAAHGLSARGAARAVPPEIPVGYFDELSDRNIMRELGEINKPPIIHGTPENDAILYDAISQQNKQNAGIPTPRREAVTEAEQLEAINREVRGQVPLQADQRVQLKQEYPGRTGEATIQRLGGSAQQIEITPTTPRPVPKYDETAVGDTYIPQAGQKATNAAPIYTFRRQSQAYETTPRTSPPREEVIQSSNQPTEAAPVVETTAQSPVVNEQTARATGAVSADDLIQRYSLMERDASLADVEQYAKDAGIHEGLAAQGLSESDYRHAVGRHATNMALLRDLQGGAIGPTIDPAIQKLTQTVDEAIKRSQNKPGMADSGFGQLVDDAVNGIRNFTRQQLIPLAKRLGVAIRGTTERIRIAVMNELRRMRYETTGAAGIHDPDEIARRRAEAAARRDERPIEDRDESAGIGLRDPLTEYLNRIKDNNTVVTKDDLIGAGVTEEHLKEVSTYRDTPYVLDALSKEGISAGELKNINSQKRIKLGQVSKGEPEDFMSIVETKISERFKENEIPWTVDGEVVDVPADVYESMGYNRGQDFEGDVVPTRINEIAYRLRAASGQSQELSRLARVLSAVDDEVRQLDIPKPSYKQYTPPGGTNYREHVITLDSANAATKAEMAGNAHLGLQEEGALFHMRTTDRKVTPIDTTKKPRTVGLFDDVSEGNVGDVKYATKGSPIDSFNIDEIQSDLHQRGQKEGYVGEPNKGYLKPEDIEITSYVGRRSARRIFTVINKRTRDILSEYQEGDDGVQTKEDVIKHFLDYWNTGPAQGTVPNVPFKGDRWVELGIKRAIKMAIEEGKDYVTWSKGKDIRDKVGGPEGLERFYDESLHKVVNRIIRGYGGNIETFLDVNSGQMKHGFKIPSKLKGEAKTKGMPIRAQAMFLGGGKDPLESLKALPKDQQERIRNSVLFKTPANIKGAIKRGITATRRGFTTQTPIVEDTLKAIEKKNVNLGHELQRSFWLASEGKAEAESLLNEARIAGFKGLDAEERTKLNAILALEREVEIERNAVAKGDTHKTGQLVTGDAQAALKALKASPDFAKLKPKIDALRKFNTDELLPFMRREGLIDSKQEANLKSKGAAFMPREYIDPLTGDEAQIHTSSRGLSTKSSGLKKIGEGIDLPINADYMTVMSHYTNALVKTAFQNRASKALWEVANDAQLAAEFGFENVATKNGVPIKKAPRGKTYVYSMHDGQRRATLVPESFGKEWIQGQEYVGGMPMKVASWISGVKPLKFFTVGGGNPAAFLGLGPMDIMYTRLVAPEYMLPIIGDARLIGDLARALPDAFVNTKFRERLAREGGLPHSLTDESNVLGTFESKGLNALNTPLGQLGRLARAKRIVRKTGDYREAAYQIKRQLPFRRGGPISKWTDNTLKPFFNVMVQSASAVSSAAKKNPGKFTAAVASYFSYAYLWSLYQKSTHNKNDEVKESTKQNYFWLPTGIMVKDKDGVMREVIATPMRKDQYVRAIGNAANIAADITLDDKMSDEEKSKQWQRVFSGLSQIISYNPSEYDLGPAEAVRAYRTNVDSYTESEIYKGAPVKPSSEYDDRTNKGLVQLAKVLSEISGGTEDKGGKIEVSPQRLEGALNSYIGNTGAGMTLKQVIESMTEGMNEEQKQATWNEWWANIEKQPLLRGMFDLTDPNLPEYAVRKKTEIERNTHNLNLRRKVDEVFKDNKYDELAAEKLLLSVEDSEEDTKYIQSQITRREKVLELPAEFKKLATMPTDVAVADIMSKLDRYKKSQPEKWRQYKNDLKVNLDTMFDGSDDSVSDQLQPIVDKLYEKE